MNYVYHNRFTIAYSFFQLRAPYFLCTLLFFRHVPEINLASAVIQSPWQDVFSHTGWRTKCHTIDCTHNTFLLLQKHLTSGTELILIGWKIVPNESVNCLSARSPPCTKVCTKTSLSRYYTLCFCIKQYNFHIFIYSQPPVVRHFTNW